MIFEAIIEIFLGFLLLLECADFFPVKLKPQYLRSARRVTNIVMPLFLFYFLGKAKGLEKQIKDSKVATEKDLKKLRRKTATLPALTKKKWDELSIVAARIRVLDKMNEAKKE